MQITLATKITIARIILIVPTVVLYVLGELLGGTASLVLLILSAVLFSVTCFTDFVDGYIARKTHTVTDLGKFLDPLADKIVVVIMLILIVLFQGSTTVTVGVNSVFAYNGLVIALLSGIIISRELMIGVFRSIVAKKGLVLAADVFGKLKTIFLNVGITGLLVASLHPVVAWISTIIFYIGAALAIYSGFNYVIKNRKVFTSDDQSVPSQTQGSHDHSYDSAALEFEDDGAKAVDTNADAINGDDSGADTATYNAANGSDTGVDTATDNNDKSADNAPDNVADVK